MVAWRLPEARGFGIEAQEESFALARRNVDDNGLGARITLAHGDLRDVTRGWPHDRCALVTGTPPYLPKGTALASPDPQRAAARLELRGGVEDYLAAAARVLGPGGRVVVCADGRAPERVIRGAAAAGLSPRRRLVERRPPGPPGRRRDRSSRCGPAHLCRRRTWSTRWSSSAMRQGRGRRRALRCGGSSG